MTLKPKILKNKYGILGGFFLLLLISTLVYQRHQNTGYFNWRSKMWSDPVGYYVYLPGLFIYGFDGTKFPENIVEKTGEGFIIDENGKIIVRYTCGIAILQAPVFLAIHAFAGLKGLEQDGFSGVYHLVSSFSAIIYAFFGLILLWHFLRFYYKMRIVFLTMLTIFFGTNLLYYTIDSTGMPHIYSFFLFALLLVLSHHYFSKEKDKKKYIFPIALVSALIVLIRPTNLLFVGLVFLLDIKSFDDLLHRIRRVFNLPNIAVLLITFFIVFLPQMIYWKYSSGSFIIDSYEGYGFTNWTSPRIKEFLFSTNNGMFPYNPLYFLIIFGLILMMFKRELNGFLIFSLFAGLIYIFSSWFVFSFGCGFGSRNFVEYTAILAIPLGFFYSDFLGKSVAKWIVAIPVILALVFVNAKLTYSYNKCFIDGDWDWVEYKYLLKARKFNKTYTYSPALSLNDKMEFSESIHIDMSKIAKVNFRRAILKTKVRIYEKDNDASIVFQITAPDTLLYWNGEAIAQQFYEDELGKYKTVKADFWLPRYYTVNSEISSFIWNVGKDSLDVKNIKIHLE